jgi:hypothetical protein
MPYLAGNKNIKTYTVIPHKKHNGRKWNKSTILYGMQPPIRNLKVKETVEIFNVETRNH